MIPFRAVVLAALFTVASMLGACAAGVLAHGGNADAATTRYSNRNDARISAEINRRLVEDPLVPAMAVRVESLDGVVTLSGKVPTHDAAARAVELARTVAGVNAVHDNLHVDH